MFAFGLMLEGRLFPFEPAQPLVALAAVADVGIGASVLHCESAQPRRRAGVAVTYEYGNTFVIVAGLLNLLVVCDAWDIASGRK